MCVCVLFFKLSLIDLFFLSAMAEDRAIDATSTVEKVFKLLHTKMKWVAVIIEFNLLYPLFYFIPLAAYVNYFFFLLIW